MDICTLSQAPSGKSGHQRSKQSQRGGIVGFLVDHDNVRSLISQLSVSLNGKTPKDFSLAVFSRIPPGLDTIIRIGNHTASRTNRD